MDIVPGHIHLQEFGKLVKEAVRAAGGVPFEFNTIGVDDGIAMGHAGMRYSLPSREIIADSVETMIEAHCFDGMVCIPNCDKITPGMAMAAMRTNIPTIFVSGGAMAAGKDRRWTGGRPDFGLRRRRRLPVWFDRCGPPESYRRRSLPILWLVFGHVHRQQHELPAGSHRPGACPITAAPWRRQPSVKNWHARQAQKIMELVAKQIKPRDIVTTEAMDDAFALDMAMGGSTNTVLHALAIAHEGGISYPLERINEVSRACAAPGQSQPFRQMAHGRCTPRRRYPAILSEVARLENVLHLDRMTVTGQPLRQSVQSASILDENVIHRLENAHSPHGGLAILFGNLAPQGAVIKTGGVAAVHAQIHGSGACI